MDDPNIAADARRAGEIYDQSVDAYVDAIGTELTAAIDGPAELEAFDDFARRVALGSSEAAPATVADIGCGPGRATAHLAALGLEAVGFDIAPGMITAAREAHPGIAFELGSLTSLPLGDRSLAGAVCWYSIIHTPLDALEAAWVELARVLRPGSPLLLGFQAGGGERVEGRLVNYRHDPDLIASALSQSGFEILGIQRRPAASAHETTDQAMVLAQTLSR